MKAAYSFLRGSIPFGVAALALSLFWCGCSKKASGPSPAAVRAVNVPQFLATVQTLPAGQRKDYVKQHQAEEQAVLQSDDPRAAQALANLLGTH